METLSDKTGAAVVVERDDELDAYVIRLVDEEVTPGKAFFIDRDKEGIQERIFFHTEVDEAFGGRGLATVLVREAVDATREMGLLIVPVCPLVRSFLEKNAQEYAGAFRKNTADDFAWVKHHRR